MLNENRVLMDAVKIFQIRHQNQRKNPWETNKNFEEFRMVYQGMLKNTVVPNRHVVRERSPIPIKTVTIELPTLGSEKAILPPKLKNKVLKPILKKKIETKEAETVTQDIVENLSRLETKLQRQESQKQIKKTPSSFLEKTNKELRIAEEQLNQLRNIMLQRHEKTKKPKTPSFKLKNKAIKHHDCIGKKYISTLSNMKQTLKKLEQKYFEKPRIVYKDVNHTFTQSKSVEILYENQKYPDDCKMDDALKGIISELDELASGEMKDTFSNARNLTFKQPVKKDPIARTIEISEAHLKQLRHFKQDIRDVEEFCDKICNITKSDTLSNNSEEETSKDYEDKEYWKNQLLNYKSELKNGKQKWNPSDTLLYEQDIDQSSKTEPEGLTIDCFEATKVTPTTNNSKNDYLRGYNIHKSCETGKFGCNQPHNLPLGSFGDQKDYEDSEIQELNMKSAFWIEQVSKKRESKDEALTFHIPGDSWNPSIQIKTFNSSEKQRNNSIDLHQRKYENDNTFLHNKDDHVLCTSSQKSDELAGIRNSSDATHQNDKSLTFNSRILENDNIQRSVMKSCYLMKEFNINPKEMPLKINQTVIDDLLTKNN